MPENLAYAATQVLHNFGAVVVLGAPAFALCMASPPRVGEKRLAQWIGAGWAVQIASGAGFGAVSYSSYGRLPEIHAVALTALAIKVACAGAGLVLALVLQSRAETWDETRRRASLLALAGLGATALAAAAFLRWFS